MGSNLLPTAFSTKGYQKYIKSNDKKLCQKDPANTLDNIRNEHVTNRNISTLHQHN